MRRTADETRRGAAAVAIFRRVLTYFEFRSARKRHRPGPITVDQGSTVPSPPITTGDFMHELSAMRRRIATVTDAELRQMTAADIDNLLSYAISVEEAVKLKEQLERANSGKQRPAPLTLAQDPSDDEVNKHSAMLAYESNRHTIEALTDAKLRQMSEAELQDLFTAAANVQELLALRQRVSEVKREKVEVEANGNEDATPVVSPVESPSRRVPM